MPTPYIKWASSKLRPLMREMDGNVNAEQSTPVNSAQSAAVLKDGCAAAAVSIKENSVRNAERKSPLQSCNMPVTSAVGSRKIPEILLSSVRNAETDLMTEISNDRNCP